MKASLSWFAKFGEGEKGKKKIEWLIKRQEKGHRVKLLDDMPELSYYETLVLKATQNCNTATDIYCFAQAFKISDLEEFFNTVIACK